METVGNRLRWARERRSLSQADLSARSGVTEATISRIENGRYGPPRPGTIRRLAEVLAVDVAWLRFGEEAEAKLVA